MYHRSRNHTSIIGFALGRDSGNGYNMYKAYQWLKSVEPSNPSSTSAPTGEWEQRRHSVPNAMNIELLVVGKTDSKGRSKRSWNSTCAA